MAGRFDAPNELVDRIASEVGRAQFVAQVHETIAEFVDVPTVEPIVEQGEHQLLLLLVGEGHEPLRVVDASFDCISGSRSAFAAAEPALELAGIVDVDIVGRLRRPERERVSNHAGKITAAQGFDVPNELSPRIDHPPGMPHGVEVFDSEAHTGFEPVLPP